MSPVVAFVALLFFASASFFFALAETALFSLGQWQLRQLNETSPRLGKKISQLLAAPQDLLATIVLGNTFANALMVGTIFWIAMQENWPLLLTVFSLLIIVLLGAEVAPKTLAVRSPELWAGRVAQPMIFLQAITRPLRVIAQKLNNLILRAAIPKSIKPQTGISEEEYQELLELAFQQGTLAKSEKEIILQIVNLDQRTAGEVMRPRSKMACVSDELSVEEMISAAKKFKHSRLPMYDETPDTIVGVLNTRGLLLDPKIDLAEVIEFPSFVPESMNLLILLKSLQRQQRGLAIVLDEFGGTAGVVTMEDILEEIVGEIRGEGSSEEFVAEKIGENRWRVSGNMRLEDFRREYPALGEVAGVETLSGLLINELGVVPQAGQAASFRGLRLTAQIADERRVRELWVEVIKRK
ncbi:MAG: hemolysin family protein [Verrucomicrobiota bacterium]|nr:hemolysin family protein [Verrucomicrobiota bacterium]